MISQKTIKETKWDRVDQDTIIKKINKKNQINQIPH